MSSAVTVCRQSVVLPTYEPAEPDRYPQFLERRVYQGSSGRVYPLPAIDRIATTPVPREWQAVYVENEYLSVMILPELGGRIHRIVDRVTGRDLIYHQPVIKPALVGLAGPWVSGGIEFNWPQHHRPSTTMPTDVGVESHADGGATVWLSEHEPVSRMKGMHGVCLTPGVARVELKGRVHNRTDDVQTFLWWANVGLEAHEALQSFFPPDVRHVADHAKRAMSTYPLCSGHYYGVDYASRARDGVPEDESPRLYRPADDAGIAANDLSWYANIPVPTSYMCLGSAGDFCGAYDHRADLGIVHVASHHISPGKKQWTWGNHDFGYAWDRNLTDAREGGDHPPYIELMTGVYTDNQPDFAWLQPGETKSWAQCWYAIHGIGVPREANREAAVNLHLLPDGRQVDVRVAVTRPQPAARVTVRLADGRVLAAIGVDLEPGKPFIETLRFRRSGDAIQESDLCLEVSDRAGALLVAFRPGKASSFAAEPPEPATAPPLPADVPSADELYLIGLHLEQYRHATRSPVDYWREALRRDPGDSRCNLALGRWHLRRGEFDQAETLLRTSVARLVSRNPNPADGEAHYQLGRCLRHLGRDDEAYAAFYKATWNQAWAGASQVMLAEIDLCRGNLDTAELHLDRAIRLDRDNLRVRNLQAVLLLQRGLTAEARCVLDETLATDPLDAWAGWLRDGRITGDNQKRLDVAHDFARAGRLREALAVLEAVERTAKDGSLPLVDYTRAWLWMRLGQRGEANRARRMAKRGDLRWCFPARLEELAILQAAVAADAADASAREILGHWLYDRRRHKEAVEQWEQAVKLNPAAAVAWRCLGMACFNLFGDAARARRAYEQALTARPGDARLIYERDQLWKRLGVSPTRRLKALRAVPDAVNQRDDLAVEYATLHNQIGRPARALEILASRQFQPWEGGEGEVSRQYERANVLLGREALQRGDAARARASFERAFVLPTNLGEGRHLLVNSSDLHFWLGEACAMAGDRGEARRQWRAAAAIKGDFQGMQVQSFSEMTAFSARALIRLGRVAQARRLLRALRDHAVALAASPAEIDYFATSLPAMLLFADDLTARQRIRARFLEAQARAGLDEVDAAKALLAEILQLDPNHALAADLAAELA